MVDSVRTPFEFDVLIPFVVLPAALLLLLLLLLPLLAVVDDLVLIFKLLNDFKLVSALLVRVMDDFK